MENGYGLYGKENYQYPPTTTDPVKTGARVGEEKFVSMEEIRNEIRNGNGNGNGYVREKQGMSDTRFLENGKYYFDMNQDVKDESRDKGNAYETNKMGTGEHVEDENSYPRNNGNGNGFVPEKQGMSDTRFLENGRYYYDVNQDVKDENRYKGNGYVTQKQGMSEHGEDENGYHENQGNGYGYGYGNGYVTEKQGMSDLENRRYHYDMTQDVENEDTYPKNRRNGNGYATEKQGMSDTRFLENGNYFYDINAEVAKGGSGHSNEYNNGNEYFGTEEEMNENYGKYNDHYYNNNNNENEGFLNHKNGYENRYNENEHYEGNNGHETQERRDHNYNPNEFVVGGGQDYHGNTKKLPPNQYDTMEEYEKEEEYRSSHQYEP